MKYKKIILAGGSGYLGGVLAKHYSPLAEEIIILSRKPHAPVGNIKTELWDGETEGPWIKTLACADMLINLSGKSINCRFTEKNKAELIRSRVVPTKLLGKMIAGMDNPPKLWINISSADIYRDAKDRPQDEETGEVGQGFSVSICQQWEAAFFEANTPTTRKVALRMGIVLGRTDGAFPRLYNLVRFGLGGRQGNGQQYISWIHEQDVANITEWLMRHEALDGAINSTAPEPQKNKDLMACIRRVYGIPFGLPAPTPLLKMGAFIIGTEPQLLLKSMWVMPKRLLDSGYTFLFPKLEDAVRDILDKHR